MLSKRFAMLGALVILPVLSQVSSTSVLPRPHVHWHGPLRLVHVNPDGSSTSSNWSGYANVGSGVSNVTSAKASWIVPTVKCSSPSTGYSAFWVGIDGYSSKTVEQTGTESDCSSGRASYSAWYEAYPAAPVTVFGVSPGDRVTASVTYSGGKFTTKIETDKGQSNSHTFTVSSAKRSSAEWIAEAPASITGVLPLADFGTGEFGDAHTGVSGTNDATIGGKTGAISAFNNTKITMDDKSHGETADPSALSGGGSFTVTWH